MTLWGAGSIAGRVADGEGCAAFRGAQSTHQVDAVFFCVTGYCNRRLQFTMYMPENSDRPTTALNHVTLPVTLS